MRVYISGPITGTDDYMERFAEAEEKLRNAVKGKNDDFDKTQQELL